MEMKRYTVKRRIFLYPDTAWNFKRNCAEFSQTDHALSVQDTRLVIVKESKKIKGRVLVQTDPESYSRFLTGWTEKDLLQEVV